MRKCLIFLVLLLFLVSCSKSNQDEELSNSNNEYFYNKYSLDHTDLNITKVTTDQIFDLNSMTRNEKFIILVLKEDCLASHDMFSDFIKTYNKNKFSFKQLYVFETDSLANTEEKELFVETFATKSTPTTLLYAEDKLYATEIGYIGENLIKEILVEFEKK